MHYRNGRAAKNGDKIVQLGWEGNITSLGILYDAKEGIEHCNGNIAPIQNTVSGACLSDCLHVEDILELLKQAGLDKRKSS